MQVVINAINAVQDKGPQSLDGRRTRVEGPIDDVEATSEGVRIWAKDCKVHGTGERGGEVTSYVHHLFVLLEPTDLQRVFEAVEEAKALQVVAAELKASAKEAAPA
jgi:hypothetical protein